MSRNFINISALLFLAIVFTSCDPNRIYEENVDIEDASWKRENKAVFEFFIEDTVSFHNLYINFRHAGNYHYRNLYLFSEIRGPEKLSSVDTVQMILADSRGKWNGKGIGDLYDYKFMFKKDVRFPKKGEYSIELEQGMRDVELNNVTDIGIRIEKAVN